jgi:HK97 family phage major capsid protein
MPTRTLEDISSDMQAIVDAAEGRSFTDAEVTAYEDYEAELVSAQRSRDLLGRHASHAAVPPPIHPGSAGVDDTTDLDEAFRDYLRTGSGNSDISHLRANINGETPSRRPRAAQSEGVGSEGGYIVPPTFRDKLVERMKAFGGIANIAEEIVTETGNNLDWATLDDTGNEGEIVNEGGTFSIGADLVFGTAALSAYRYATSGASATPIRISVELLQDAAFDVDRLVSRKLGERLGRVQARHLAVGTGVGQPLGLVTGLVGLELVADTAGLTYDDLVNFTHGPDPAYRESGNCRWVFNDTMLATVQKIKDSHGDPIWSRMGPMMDAPLPAGYLLGYPITIDQGLPTMTAADNTINWGAFGDIREGYVVRRVRSIVIVVNPWSRANNGQVEYSAWARMDATQQNTNAYVALTGEA